MAGASRRRKFDHDDRGAFCAATTRRRLVLSLGAAMLLSTAEEIVLPSLPEIAKEAEFIGWVRVTGKMPVAFQFDGRSEVCGFNYSAQVVQRIKGSGDAVQFFSTHDVSGDREGDDYFVIVQRLRAGPSDWSDLKGVEKERTRCELEASEYSVRGAGPSRMVPLARELSGRGGEQWFRRDASNILWGSNFTHRDFQQEGQPMGSGVSWSSIKESVEAALKDPRY